MSLKCKNMKTKYNTHQNSLLSMSPLPEGYYSPSFETNTWTWFTSGSPSSPLSIQIHSFRASQHFQVHYTIPIHLLGLKCSHASHKNKTWYPVPFCSPHFLHTSVLLFPIRCVQHLRFPSIVCSCVSVEAVFLSHPAIHRNPSILLKNCLFSFDVCLMPPSVIAPPLSFVLPNFAITSASSFPFIRICNMTHAISMLSVL